jgi:syntaxin 18
MSTLSRVPASSFTKYLGLPANLLSSSAQQSEEQLNLHRQQVTVFLSRRLADVGKIQQEQQELRVKRQLERQNLSSNLSIPASAMSGSSITKNATKGPEDPAAVPSAFVPAPLNYDDDDQDGYEPIDTVLSASQIQQFESESSALLQEANSQLAAIEKAQTSLLEISQMQTELAMHLGQQMELTDKLWEDSVLVTGRVEEGNVQLRKARERNREGRIWLLVFLIGASLSLL